MGFSRRASGEAKALALLIGGLVVVLGALIGFTVAFARPLPTGAWVGFGVVVAVAVVLSLAAFLLVFRADRPSLEPGERAVPAPGDARLHLLVVANETIGSDELRRQVCERVTGCESQVLVIAPALNTPLRHWTDEEERARAEADRRLRDELAMLAKLGVEAEGQVAADDPLQAVDDALRTFPADEILISTHPRDGSNWLEQGVVGRVRAGYGLPVTHLIIE